MFLYGSKNAIADSRISCYSVKLELQVYIRRQIYSDAFDLDPQALLVIIPSDGTKSAWFGCECKCLYSFTVLQQKATKLA